MNAHRSIPVRLPAPLYDEDEEWPLGSARNPASLDDDMGFEDDLLPLSHPSMKEAIESFFRVRRG